MKKNIFLLLSICLFASCSSYDGKVMRLKALEYKEAKLWIEFQQEFRRIYPNGIVNSDSLSTEPQEIDLTPNLKKISSEIKQLDDEIIRLHYQLLK